jgi:starch-binding outer membrane protein, SusD/RagB family
MFMKRLLIILFACFVVNACNDDFLNIENKNNLTIENWYQTADDFQAALNSCYIHFMSRGMFALRYNNSISTWEDRTLFETTGNDRLMEMTPSSELVTDIYQSLFAGVYRTTRLLQKLNEKGVDGIEGMTQQNFNYIAAQARALRGMTYFYLIVFFDTPILYNETNYPEDLMTPQGNGDRKEIWAQIEKDLSEAAEHLKLRSQLAPEEFGRITKGAAIAQLGKALLYKHFHFYERFGNGTSPEAIADLQRAKNALLEVINSFEYQLIQPKDPKTENDYLYALLSNTSYVDLVSENNTYQAENNMESVWEIQFDDAMALGNNQWFSGYYSSGALNSQWYSPLPSSYKNWEVHPAMYHAFETDGSPAPFQRDPRLKASIYSDGDLLDFDPSSDYYIPFSGLTMVKRVAVLRKLPNRVGFGLGVKKSHFPVYYKGNQAPFNDPVNKRVIRYADVLLMYAEVMFLLGDDGSGLNALNQVRQRVDMPDVPALTTQAIMHERDIELCFEGHRWLDLVRWSFSPTWNIDWNAIDWGIDATNSVNPFVVGKNEYMPFPITEIDVNQGKLIQNSGY